MIFVAVVGSRAAGGMAETEASPYNGSIGDSRQHQLYGTSFIFCASESLMG